MSTDDATKTLRDDRTEPLAPGDRPSVRMVGRFRIEAPLGSGGMADVYRAHDPFASIACGAARPAAQGAP